MDYAMFYRRAIDVNRMAHELPVFDIYISAFNSSDRVNNVFAAVRAHRRIWLIHPEYQYLPLDLPTSGDRVLPSDLDEVSQVNALLAEAGPLSGLRICVDITGFMRHVLAFLIAKLAHDGVKEFYAIYSEPMSYVRQEQTTFSTQTSGLVRPVRGMGASTNARASDVLILGVGYDDKLISQVATSKDGAAVYPVFAFPSLSPDMYQQSAVRAASSGEVALTPAWISNRRFAPANDPFSTAQILSEIVDDVDRSSGEQPNIYLSPLATKVQTLGFAIYWQLQGALRGAVSLILPQCITYSRETSAGLKRLWLYTVEL